MQKRHLDSQQYIDEQAYSSQKYILPFISEVKEIKASMQVLEIGCGEAGNLKPFLDLGCFCTGIDFSKPKIANGKIYFASHKNAANISLISDDIYQTNEFDAKFDIIFLRDVIEHIHDQEKFLALMKKLLAPNGIAMFAFPPWQNPFGGHQQICESKLLSSLPFFHLFPNGIYKRILSLFGESDAKITTLLEVKETGISLERFERIVKTNNYKILRKRLYFINPYYEIKFGLKPRKLNKLLGKITYIRNFFSTSGYYIICNN